ncbi:hypothetical protein GDO78_018555, partial [Eleutherodactylus coqui]
VCAVLFNVCRKEGLVLPQELARKIAEKSGRNLRKALLMCEACRVQQYPFSSDQDVPETDWEVYVKETANVIVSQQNPQRFAYFDSEKRKFISRTRNWMKRCQTVRRH